MPFLSSQALDILNRAKNFNADIDLQISQTDDATQEELRTVNRRRLMEDIPPARFDPEILGMLFFALMLIIGGTVIGFVINEKDPFFGYILFACAVAVLSYRSGSNKANKRAKKAYDKEASLVTSQYVFQQDSFVFYELSSIEYVAQARTIGAATYLDISRVITTTAHSCNINKKHRALLQDSSHKEDIGCILLSKNDAFEAIEQNELILKKLEAINQGMAARLHKRKPNTSRDIERLRKSILKSRSELLKQFEQVNVTGFDEEELARLNAFLTPSVDSQINYRQTQVKEIQELTQEQSSW